MKFKGILIPLIPLMLVLLGSCSRLLGWGVLLWSVEDPAIPSGAVLPVYIRSNIDQVWVAGIPGEYRTINDNNRDKFELPIGHLSLVGKKRAALARAEEFSVFAAVYAETLQDRLPIRENPDNNARWVYRLRQGQIVKIIAQAEGTPAIGADGSPLQGNWFMVLTEDGVTGYCFSYRLRMFEHTVGPFMMTQAAAAETEDPELEQVLSQKWYPESYETMISQRRIDLDDLSRGWSFSPGLESGVARLYLPNIDRSFAYSGIRRIGSNTWLFEGTNLRINLRTGNILAVMYSEEGSAQRTVLFTVLDSDIRDIVLQETERRQAQFRQLYSLGPVFQSANYGTLSFTPDKNFNWQGFRLLVGQVIPEGSSGSGSVDMGVFLPPALSADYTGVFSLYFDGNKADRATFMYTIESQGLRLEYVPQSAVEGLTVTRRSSSPLIIYFYKRSR